MTLEKKEMLNITGGGISPWVIFGIGAVVTFLAGVFDGFVRPPLCK